MQGMVGNNLWEEEACGVGQKVGVVTHYSGTSALIGWRDGLIRRRKKRRCGVGEEEEEEEEGGEEEAEDDRRKKTGEKEYSFCLTAAERGGLQLKQQTWRRT